VVLLAFLVRTCKVDVLFWDVTTAMVVSRRTRTCPLPRNAVGDVTRQAVAGDHVSKSSNFALTPKPEKPIADFTSPARGRPLEQKKIQSKYDAFTGNGEDARRQ